jgi:signal transduction histidine kinase/DNA-binding response OmpR family regulator/HPt (histidine-containing phosphotransfer) domain-containing protein
VWTQLNRLQISQRLTGIIAIGGLTLTVVSVLFMVRLSRASTALEALRQEADHSDQARVMQVNFKKQVQEWKDILLRGSNPADLTHYVEAFHARSAEVTAEGEALEHSVTNPETRELVQQFRSNHREMSRKYEDALAVFMAGGGRNPFRADSMVRGQDRAPTDLIDKIVASNVVLRNLRAEQDAINHTKVLLLLTLPATIVLLLLAGSQVSRSITQSLDETVAGLERVAGGELDHRVAIIGNDEVARMNRALNATVSSLKHTQERLAHAVVAAETANQAKSEFLANMSHEIRTPMNGVIGLTELVLETDLTPHQAEQMGLIKSSADALMVIINDILDFSKIEAGKLELDPIPFDLRTCIDETIRSLAPRAHQKELELLYEVDPALPPALIGDAGRIRQILVNLLSNAVKFTERGEVVLRVHRDGSAEGVEQLHFVVSDTGIGIPPEKQAGIFDPFSQADTSTTRRFGGTGLGLTITTRLVALMRGRLWVESIVGKGSNFHLAMALPAAEAPPVSPPELHLADFHGLSVLVVDDNATNRRILEGTLTGWGLRPTLVDGGRAALAALEEAHAADRQFGLVILDYHMPDMDGFEVADCIRRQDALRATTIMMLSSAGIRGDAQRCRQIGVDAYLTKPVRQSTLLDAVLAVLQPGSGGVAGVEPIGLVTRHSLKEPATSLRVLLAEDNEVNQVVATRMLQRRGHRIEVVSDGRQAVERFRHEQFDVILMDMQMPVLDGREATRAIRELERTRGGHVPIIAVTASAMKGDRESALEAGLDGYITKPVTFDSLIYAVEHHGTDPTEVPNAMVGPTAMLDHFGGDLMLLRIVAQTFLEIVPALRQRLLDAAATADLIELRAASHSLKGSAGNFGPNPATDLARQIEERVREDRGDDARALCPAFVVALDALVESLHAVVASGEDAGGDDEALG